MSPFQALYGYPPPIFNIAEPLVILVAKVEDLLVEKQQLANALRENLLIAQNWIKQYANLKRIEREFNVGD